MPKTHAARRSGVALITSLAILVVVSLLVLGSILTTQVELAVTRNDNSAAQAQYIAQAGLQSTKAALFQTFRWLEAGGSSGTSLDACTNSLGSGIDFLRTGTEIAWSGNQIALSETPVLDVAGNEIGRYTVTLLQDPTNENRITIQSVGRTLDTRIGRSARATATATFIIRNSSSLEQAIFAGSGSDMRFVNGNTTVYGGIYIVGDIGDPADPDDDNYDTIVIEANGNLGIFNAYDKTGVGNFLESAVQRSSNLCASLRVQAGTVAVGGSTQLGTPSDPLLTVAVSRGLEDITTARGGTLQCRSNKGVCTETPPGPFDLDPASAPVFPMLDESPATEFCPDPTAWRTCIRDEAEDDGLTLIASAGTLSTLNGVDLSTQPDCQAFLQAAASGSRELAFGGTSYDCRYTDPTTGRTVGFNYVAGTPAQLSTFGNLNFRGFDLRFDRAVEYTASSWSSAGTTQQFGGLSVESNGGGGGTFTANQSFTTATISPFPSNVLTVIAEGDVNLRGGNNTYFTMPVYAGGQFRITSSSVLFGQVIADQFCTTTPGGSDPNACASAGSPSEIAFVPTGDNRPRSFRAIAPTGGLPTFTTVAYELR